MIAVDTSTMVAYLAGETGQDIEALQSALLRGKLRICPIVITEVLSGTTNPNIKTLLKNIERLEFLEGFWERAGASRLILIKNGLKAKVADAVIAQSAIDHKAPLLTRDKDFRHYAKHCDLKLA